MASADQVALRARFLHEGAYLLAVSSPTAASFLGIARNRLVEDAELELPSKEADASRRSICGACGNAMIPGWSCKVSNTTKTKPPGTKDKSINRNPTMSEKSNMYTCLRCHRETQQMLQPTQRRQLRRPESLLDTKSVSNIGSSTKIIDDITPKTINASSKQRQRARKGGLQAMLDQKKKQTSGIGGFDLMDFAM
jgi:hypothetical protein